MTMLRLALGSFKDQAAIGKAIISGHCLFADVDIAIVRATAHDDAPADEKYVNEILFLVSNSRGSTNFLAERISRRLEKTHDPVVALKTLLLVHRLMRGGDRSFEQELFSSQQSGYLRMNKLHCLLMRNGYCHQQCLVSFIHNYASFLEERMCWVINQGGKLVPVMQRCLYKNKSVETVFYNLPKCQTFLDRAMDCLPLNDHPSSSDKLTQAALAIILRESIHVYNSFCEGVATLADSILEFNKKAREEALDIFKQASSQSYKLFDFFERCQRLMVIDNRTVEYPSVQIIGSGCVKSLEGCVSCSSEFDDGMSLSSSVDRPLPITEVIDLSETPTVEAVRDDEVTVMIKEVDSGFSLSYLETRISTIWVEFNDEDDFSESTHSSNEGLDEPSALGFDGLLTTDGRLCQSSRTLDVPYTRSTVSTFTAHGPRPNTKPSPAAPAGDRESSGSHGEAAGNDGRVLQEEGRVAQAPGADQPVPPRPPRIRHRRRGLRHLPRRRGRLRQVLPPRTQPEVLRFWVSLNRLQSLLIFSGIVLLERI